jgi:hypothetical protein
MTVMNPVAPPSQSDVAPVVVQPEVVAEQPKQDTISSQYELAAQSRNPLAMMQVAQASIGTPIADVAIEAAKNIHKSNQVFDSLVKPIEDAGGINTPEGRVKMADTWKTVKDHPQWGTALVEHLLGNPNARLQVTGGTVKPRVTYDDQGRMLQQYENELGEIVKVVDVGSRREISPEEYAKIGGGRTSLENTLARKAQLENQKENLAEFNKNQKATGAWAAAAPELNTLYEQKQNMLKQLIGSGLNNKQLEELSSFTTRQIGSAQSMSKGFSDLDQFVRSRGTNVEESVKKGAQAAASKLGLRLSADGSITNAKGEKVDSNSLNQLQKSFSENNTSEQNFSQTQEQLAKNLVYKNLGLKEKQIFDSILEIDRRIESKTGKLSSEYGQPSFLVAPSAMGIADQFARAEVQAIQGRFNAAAIQEYEAWKADQLKNYPAGQVPSPNELEKAFTKTQRYIDLKDKYMQESMDTRKRVIEAFPEGNEASAAAPKQPRIVPEKPGVSPTSKGEAEDKRAKLREQFRSK